MKTKSKTQIQINNPVLRATAKLVKAIREADEGTCEEAAKYLQDFADTWLSSGDGSDLDGAGACCLADTDTTEAVRGALEIWAENKSL